MATRLDIVLFGATGFTGQHCIPYLHKLTKANGRNLTWGISGRSEEKLKEVLKNVGTEIKADLESIPVIIADVGDEDSLLQMANRAKIVVNCCGPYRYYGEPVVKACIEAGTHHVDVSGEPEYMEKMQLKYHDEAVKKGVYAISACGFDSIPSDLGIIYTQQEFNGTLNAVAAYIKAVPNDSTSKISGPIINYGTYVTLIESFANLNNRKEIAKQLKLKKLPKYKPRLAVKKLPHRNSHFEGWSIPFLGADHSVIRRTQTYIYEEENQRPVQAAVYVTFLNFFTLILLLFLGLIMFILTRFKEGTEWLKKYPELFSMGMMSKKPPSEEAINKAKFEVYILSEGWKEKLSDKNEEFTEPPNKFMTTRVTGTNPGYGATCLAVVMSAIVILTEKEKLAGKGQGGVYTPGATFMKTSLIKQLNENGLTFEVVDPEKGLNRSYQVASKL